MKYDEFKQKHSQKLTKQRKTPEHREDNLQKQCVEWFKTEAYPQLATLLFHPNNEAFYGGSATHRKITGSRMRDMGVTAGVADLILLHPGSDCHGLCIELKQGHNIQQDQQHEWEKAVTAQGYRYVVCKSIEQFKNIIEQYLQISPKSPNQAAIDKLFGPGFKARIHET